MCSGQHFLDQLEIGDFECTLKTRYFTSRNKDVTRYTEKFNRSLGGLGPD